MEDIVNFRPLRPKRKFSKLSQEVVKKIAADQQYLFRIVTAVINGSGQFKEDKSLAKTSPGTTIPQCSVAHRGQQETPTVVQHQRP